MRVFYPRQHDRTCPQHPLSEIRRIPDQEEGFHTAVSDKPQVVADIKPPHRTARARAIREIRLHSHFVSNFEIIHTFSNLLDSTTELMSQDCWERATCDRMRCYGNRAGTGEILMDV